jgi:hypothetical protein
MMRKSLIRAVAIAPLTLLFAAGCKREVLAVLNTNSPDVVRVYSTAASVEGVVQGLGSQFWSGFQGSSEGMNVQSKNIALETYGSVANFGMNTRNAIPRSEINNARDFSSFSKVTRNATTAIQALDRLIVAAKAAGATNALGSPAQDARARAFAFFINGASLGYLAMAYDSAAIVTPAVASDVVPDLSFYPDVAAAGLALMDSAIAITTSANASVGTNGFPLPSIWFNGLAMTQAQFVQFIKAHQARVRAGVARTPTERAAVNWTQVIADANAAASYGDFVVTIGTGWGCAYDCSQMEVSAGWGQITPMYSFMADTSGNYKAWLATSINSRNSAILVVTPDTRWPAGSTRLAQQTASTLPSSTRYITNRNAGGDVSGDVWGTSFYDHTRWYALAKIAPVGQGPYTYIDAQEMTMLAAEGYIRTNNLSAATTLINASRATAGLPAIAVPASASVAITPATAGAFSATGCVPQVPNSAGNSASCGSILEAMKYEKRMETQHTGYMQWFVDSRGWGDLVENSPLQWPVPNGEMDARVHPFYNSSKSKVVGGGFAIAAKGTYGF